ncbi:uncharacterized protein LOC110989410 [Acanthaster planci]|uniref:Uncharacterized protein LOC110989410 n=1 Tax=Acanthaster planci TaxID=133434 RepID=A0A8B7ZVN1_ACAPL|nr:uncharacterized protein LOC110989410 [Acanthaster planci]
MKAALVALLFLCAVGSTFAVECYSCSYTTGLGSDKSCADPFGSGSGVSKVTCNGQCTKSSSKKDGEALSVTRGCSELCVDIDCQTVLGVEVCANLCCDGNLCNGAGPVTFSVVAMAAMVAAARAFSF